MTSGLTSTRHILPFASLSPGDFERLVYWLLVAEAFQDLEHVGAAGKEHGVDIVAYRLGEHGRERIYVQCKRVTVFSPSAFEGAVEKVRLAVEEGLWPQPTRMLFAVTVEPSAEARRRCIAACEQAGFGCEFLTLHELDRRVKLQPEALWEFFEVEDQRPRNTPVDSMRLPPANFVDREGEHARLTGWWREAVNLGRSGLVVVHGVGGVGKSSLVRAWAHRNRERFPGGCFQIDLTRLPDGGADMSRAVSDLLADLGMPRSAQPADYGDRVREYRRLADRVPMVLLIRGARSDAEVMTFVPAGSGSMVLVTSRDRMDSLMAAGGDSIRAEPLGLGPAAELVAAVAGVDAGIRVTTQELVDYCAGLPLFLTTCAAWFVGRSESARERLFTRIQTRDPILRAELPLHVFDESYRGLNPKLQRAYRRLLGGPLTELTAFAASALLDVDELSAETECDALAALGLLEESGVGKWVGHALLREHASQQSTETGDEERAALLALVRRYAWAATYADSAIVADRPRLGLRAMVPEPRTSWEIRTREAAHTWWLRERSNALLIAEICTAHGWHAELMLLAEGSWPMAVTLKTMPEWEGIQILAAQAASRAGNDLAEARFRSQLARAFADAQNFSEALKESAAAMNLAHRSGDAIMIASTTEFDGICRLEKGDALGAIDAFDQARAGFSELGLERGVALQDYYTSRALLQLGRPYEALMRSEAAHDSLVMAGDEISVVRSQLRQAEAHIALGNLEAATEAARRALATSTANGHWFESAEAHDVLATCAGTDIDLASAHRAAAREMYRRIGHPRGLD